MPFVSSVQVIATRTAENFRNMATTPAAIWHATEEYA
jgi:hypothetical protein